MVERVEIKIILTNLAVHSKLGTLGITFAIAAAVVIGVGVITGGDHLAYALRHGDSIAVLGN
jgi:hypothetical protein